jgi:Amt family ammonium transporter
MAGVFATASVSATAEGQGVSGAIEGHWAQLGVQLVGVLVVTAWCALGTYVALKATSALAGLRVGPDEERQGLDLSLHGEALHQ